jgi:hypothetical protein
MSGKYQDKKTERHRHVHCETGRADLRKNQRAENGSRGDGESVNQTGCAEGKNRDTGNGQPERGDATRCEWLPRVWNNIPYPGY